MDPTNAAPTTPVPGATTGTTGPSRARFATSAPQAQGTAAPQTAGSSAEAATTVATSGATVEQAVVDALPMDHPAVDDKPRAGLPPESSRIDFNDPSF